MKFPYDNNYYPPAPMVDMTLGPPDESLTIGPLRAFVDSGADATIIPAHYIQPLGLQVDDRKYLRTPWGDRRVVDIYYLDVGIGEVRLPFIEVVADDEGDEIILGRSVLNKLRVLLDGPAQRIEVSP